MSEDSILENLDEIISKEEILKLYESVVNALAEIVLVTEQQQVRAVVNG